MVNEYILQLQGIANVHVSKERVHVGVRGDANRDGKSVQEGSNEGHGGSGPFPIPNQGLHTCVGPLFGWNVYVYLCLTTRACMHI